MVDDVVSRLVRIETKQDILLERENDHEDRLRWLEKEQWLHRGGAAVISAIALKLGLGPWFSH